MRTIKWDCLNWLGMRPWRCYVVADKRLYGVHGIRVHSAHRDIKRARQELGRLHRQGDSTQTIYKVVL